MNYFKMYFFLVLRTILLKYEMEDCIPVIALYIFVLICYSGCFLTDYFQHIFPYLYVRKKFQIRFKYSECSLKLHCNVIVKCLQICNKFVKEKNENSSETNLDISSLQTWLHKEKENISRERDTKVSLYIAKLFLRNVLPCFLCVYWFSLV